MTTPTLDLTAEVLDQLEFHWHGQLRPRLDGLTDEEYRWEPVPGSWNVRPRDEPAPAIRVGSGEHTIDFAFPPPEPAPVTTIAWRLCHVVVGVFGARVAGHFGGPAYSYETTDYPGTADEALRLLDETHDAWVAGVRGLSAADLAVPVGAEEPGYEERSMLALVLHIHREVLHHGAEIALLRDLYGARFR